MTKDMHGQMHFSLGFDMSLSDFNQEEIQLMQAMLGQFYNRLQACVGQPQNDVGSQDV